jgi:hypothetical protein
MTNLDSPALQYRNPDYYPPMFQDRVPKRVRFHGLSTKGPRALPGIRFPETGTEWDVWVNSQGAVALLVDGKTLGVVAAEFEVIEWHETPSPVVELAPGLGSDGGVDAVAVGAEAAVGVEPANQAGVNLLPAECAGVRGGLADCVDGEAAAWHEESLAELALRMAKTYARTDIECNSWATRSTGIKWLDYSEALNSEWTGPDSRDFVELLTRLGELEVHPTNAGWVRFTDAAGVKA